VQSSKSSGREEEAQKVAEPAQDNSRRQKQKMQQSKDRDAINSRLARNSETEN